MPKVTILDDYQQVALTCADWSAVQADFEVQAIPAHVADDELANLLQDSKVVVAMRERTPFSAELLARLPSLRLPATTGRANKSTDLHAAAAQGITVCGTTGTGNAMPEITIGMIIALARNFVQEDASIRAGGWQHTVGVGLQGRTLGVVGLGRLGIPVADLARA